MRQAISRKTNRRIQRIVKSLKSPFKNARSITAGVFAFSALLFLPPCPAQQAASPLAQHPSLYLAMHANDPVNWMLWQKNALQLAQRNNKLILLSSGYFSCHWCHVMQQEVYQNPSSAQLLNDRFISIKVDRELNPQLDSQMLEFARKYHGSAGWPQHLILTPDGLPITAFTYLPNAKLQKLLTTVDKLWKEYPDKIHKLAKSAIPDRNQTVTEWNPLRFQKALYQQLRERMDEFSGGLNGSNKFPKSPLLLALIQEKSLPEPIEDWLLLSLQKMAGEHLFDHLYGGFFRYTIDPEWQIPHFEKMLYDNAQLLQLYLLADLRWPNHGFAATAEATLRYLRETLYSPRLKLYLGSQSAIDSKGHEGGGYLFSKRQLAAILPENALRQVQTEWFAFPEPFASGYLIKPTSHNWEAIRNRLLQKRPKPDMPIDSKAITGWNALLLKALLTAEIWRSQQTNLDATPHLAKSPEYAQELATELLALSRRQQIPRALTDPETSQGLEGEATLSDLSFLWDALKAWKKRQRMDLGLSNLERQVKKFKTSDGWEPSHQLRLYPQSYYVFKDDAIPGGSVKLGCDFIDIKIDRTDFYQNPMHYASYLLLDKYR
ncbi:thioredoxin domain-containing protein [Thiomicrorhabdus xiamenensis]|uniref:Thioredoxin domain-containing protein n=1 Tax=Thiomicrorhabdus xiamenensis TaxID=2739063 RepID=A0A7D4SRA5_9GAMM|nr:DUF255 domain-containing protein [Thiomicrorhabdus xiamenensis]QKI88243.1 thioredoxin domain-containing protein [Thiomicrorhabdus xiamenensis]